VGFYPGAVNVGFIACEKAQVTFGQLAAAAVAGT
jgi:hypothetical protein